MTLTRPLPGIRFEAQARPLREVVGEPVARPERERQAEGARSAPDHRQELLDRGQAFGAHEVLESAWKDGPDSERALWQGLAQLAVGVTHVQRGNRSGAAALLRRASGRLRLIELPVPHGIDLAGLIEHADALVDDLDGGREIPPDRLRIRLLGAD